MVSVLSAWVTISPKVFAHLPHTCSYHSTCCWSRGCAAHIHVFWGYSKTLRKFMKKRSKWSQHLFDLIKLHWIILLFKTIGFGKIFYVFERRLNLFDQKYSTNSNIVKYYYNLLFYYILNVNIFLWTRQTFQYHYSSLQCHMILQKSL